MNDDGPPCNIHLCPEYESPRPINLRGDPPRDDSGFLIVRFKPGTLDPREGDLAAAAKQASLKALIQTMEEFQLRGKPLITSVKPDELDRMQKSALRAELPPVESLTAYWRLDVRHVMHRLEEIEAVLRRLPEIELVYREKTPSDPVMAGDDTYAGFRSAASGSVQGRATVAECSSAAGRGSSAVSTGWRYGRSSTGLRSVE